MAFLSSAPCLTTASNEPARWPANAGAPLAQAMPGSQRGVRMDLQIDLRYEIDSYGADFVFNIHAA